MAVLLLDHAGYRPKDELLFTHEVAQTGRDWQLFSDENFNFMWKVLMRSGIGKDSTFLPKAIHPHFNKKPEVNIKTCMDESEEVMTGALSEVLERTGLQATDIDILITACSIFCPTPDLGSMLVNKFKMRPDCQTYNLSGMGCSVGVVAINLVKDMLMARPNSICVLVASENVTYCFYPGQDRNRLVANAIFRMGGAAAVFTNKPELRARAKYQLYAIERAHTGADDTGYRCMSWSDDAVGTNGVYLGKDVVQCAGDVIKAVMIRMAPKVMTWSQYAAAAINIVQRNVLGFKSVKQYAPDWTKCVDHFALHSGGHGVLKGIQAGMKLPASKMLPSFASLHEYGNTSCSTTWYTIGYIETCVGVKKGERVLQLGIGAGMLAGACGWVALRDIKQEHSAWKHLGQKPLTEADLFREIDSHDEHKKH